jgi:hypothetical protein
MKKARKSRLPARITMRTQEREAFSLFKKPVSESDQRFDTNGREDFHYLSTICQPVIEAVITLHLQNR